MATAIARLRVENFDHWRAEYESMHTVREAAGECGRRLYRDAADPNVVVVMFEWDTADRARDYFEGSVLAASVARANGVGGPEVWYCEAV